MNALIDKYNLFIVGGSKKLNQISGN